MGETGRMPIPQEKPASCGVGVPPAQSIGARCEYRHIPGARDGVKVNVLDFFAPGTNVNLIWFNYL